MSQDDALVALGTEVGSIELYSLKKLLKGDPQRIGAKAEAEVKPQESAQPILTRCKHPSFIRCYQTKASGVTLVKFSWRNFLTAVGCVEKNYC